MEAKTIRERIDAYTKEKYGIDPEILPLSHENYEICRHTVVSPKEMNKIVRIRTGGQSGVDRAALDFAIEQGIPYCGWCPKGGWAEDYPDPPGVLADYPELTETPSAGTAQRTKWNMRDCDAILTIIPEGSAASPGTDIGLEEGNTLGKPMFTAAGEEDVPAITEWIRQLPDGTELCVGGPRASECPEAYDVARRILDGIVRSLRDECPERKELRSI